MFHNSDCYKSCDDPWSGCIPANFWDSSSINEDRLWVYLASLWYEGPRKIVGRCKSRPSRDAANSRKSSAFCRTAYSPCAANKFTSLNLWPGPDEWCAWTRLDLGFLQTQNVKMACKKAHLSRNAQMQYCRNLPMIPRFTLRRKEGSRSGITRALLWTIWPFQARFKCDLMFIAHLDVSMCIRLSQCSAWYDASPFFCNVSLESTHGLLCIYIYKNTLTD